MALPIAAVALGSVLLAGGAAVAVLPDRPPPPVPPASALPPSAGSSGGPASGTGVGARTPVTPFVAAVGRSRPAGASSADAARWASPLAGPLRVVRGFDPPSSPWLPGHRGVDLAALPGDAVLAAGAGIVTFAGPLAGRGVVTVTHGPLRTTYEPVSAAVSVGDQVGLGERIGVLGTGSTHCGGVPPCLHWGLRRGTTYLDPLLLLGQSPPVLLPIPSR